MPTHPSTRPLFLLNHCGITLMEGNMTKLQESWYDECHVHGIEYKHSYSDEEALT